jgi:CRISPR system Cascade subunit CasC
MSEFIQLHILTSYPPANLNRDDLGRPKTAFMGGCQRLRISSQSLKRAWRTSSLFEESLKGHVGTRTKEIGLRVFKQLRNKGVAEAQARKWAQTIAEIFGKRKGASKDNSTQDLEIEQLAHFSPEELQAIDSLADKLAQTGKDPGDEELALLKKEHSAADIAMFGRMLADKPAFNVEAAVQVAHSITVHEVAVEDDYFTAVDDLNEGIEDVGAAHIGETAFAAGLFYLYVCINRDLLVSNLNQDVALARCALRALTESTVKIAPTGKQSSFASRAFASYVLAEIGSEQPRSLAVAFLKPIRGKESGMLDEAISALEFTRTNMDKVYGPCADSVKSLNAATGQGSLKEILDFVEG